MRLGTCEGELLASLPIAPAAGNHAVTTLPDVPFSKLAGTHDLCMRFTRAGIDPIWTIDSIELLGL